MDALELGYDDIGTGQSVLFIHGFPLNRTMWAPQQSALVERCRCIAADLRGFGESTPQPPYSMAQYADDLARLLDQVRIDQTVVVGLSMGGYVGFEFWRRHRERVRGLVLADTKATADTEKALASRRELITVARTEGSTAVANLQIAGIVGKTTREKHPDTYDSVHRMIAQAGVEGIVGALEAMMARPDSTPTLATIDIPTLIVVGEEDSLTPVKDARAMQSAIAGSRLEVIAQAGHLSNMERPAAFNHVLTEFLAALKYS
ncbi:MAG: alpha/beta fold hydrolase [Gemmatimonadaceae bacterium]